MKRHIDAFRRFEEEDHDCEASLLEACKARAGIFAATDLSPGAGGRGKNERQSKGGGIVGASVLVAAVGAWLFIKNGIPGYLFFRAPFAMFDDTKSLLCVHLENPAMLALFAAVGAACASVTGSHKSEA